MKRFHDLIESLHNEFYEIHIWTREKAWTETKSVILASLGTVAMIFAIDTMMWSFMQLVF